MTASGFELTVELRIQTRKLFILLPGSGGQLDTLIGNAAAAPTRVCAAPDPALHCFYEGAAAL